MCHSNKKLCLSYGIIFSDARYDDSTLLGLCLIGGGNSFLRNARFAAKADIIETAIYYYA